MPRYRTERLNGHKFSTEYPAKLVVNRRIVVDEFPDWYQILEYDRYQLACGNYSPPNRPQNASGAQTSQSTSQGDSRGTITSRPVKPPVSYAQVVASAAQQQQRAQVLNMSASLQAQTISMFSTTRPVLRYTTNNPGNQDRQYGSTNNSTATTNTIACILNPHSRVSGPQL